MTWIGAAGCTTRSFDIHARSAGDTDGVNSVSGYYREEVDSKAMRKIAPNETIFGSLQVVEVGTAVMEAFFDSRMLVKLS